MDHLRRSRATDPHAQIILFDLDLGEIGFVEDIGQIPDQFLVDRRFSCCHRTIAFVFVVAGGNLRRPAG
jgi:hypothetical protein